MPLYKKNRLIILYACTFVVMIGFGLILPVLPFYIERMALTGGVSSSLVATHVGLLTGVFALVQFLMAPLWGQLSDRIGRRPLFLIGLGGYAVSMLCFGMGTSLTLLYTARITGGIFAAAILPTATAYVADVTPRNERGRGMAWLGSAVSLGIVIGPGLGGFLSQLNTVAEYNLGPFRIDNFSAPFFATALLALLTLAAAMRWLPESLQKPAPETPANQEKEAKAQLPSRVRRLIPAWLVQFLIFAFVSQFALAAFEGTFALHAQELLGYGPAQMGVVFVVCGLVMALAQGLIVSRLIEKTGERILLPIGFALTALGLALLMITEQTLYILLNVTLFALGIAFITPCLAALVSKRSDRQAGASLGFLNSANSLGQAGGPALGGYLFIYQIHLPYLLATALLAFCAIYLAGILLKKPAKAPHRFPE